MYGFDDDYEYHMQCVIPSSPACSNIYTLHGPPLLSWTPVAIEQIV